MATATAPKPADASPSVPPKSNDADFLAERGWVEQANGMWADMSPPTDSSTEHRVADSQGRTERVVRQVRAGPPPGWHYPYREALNMERARTREPLPYHHAFRSKWGPKPEEENPAERKDEWNVRDRWKNILHAVGTHGSGAEKYFETKEAAEEWIAKNGKNHEG